MGVGVIVDLVMISFPPLPGEGQGGVFDTHNRFARVTN